VNTSNGTATAGSDYTALSSVLVTIPAGSTTATINVSIAGDLIVEENETFTATISDAKFDGATDATRVVIGDASGTGTINNNDSASISGAATVAEGSVYTLTLASTDPTTSSWLVNWGDGPAELVSGNPGSVTHIYADGPTNYVISATVTGSGGTFAATSTVSVSVTNAAPAPTINGVTTSPEGTAINLTVSPNDPGSVDTFTYQWSVVSSNGQVIANGTSATYGFTPVDDGTYTVTVTVTDNNGASGTDTHVITVTDVAPTVNFTAISTPVNENSTASVTFNLADPGLGDLAATGQVVVNWGDGTQTVINSGAQLTTLQSGGSVTLTKVYADDSTPGTSSDTFNLTVDSIQLSPTLTFTNMSLASGSLPAAVVVNNVAPTGLFVTSTPSVPQNTPVSVNWLSSTDTSPADIPGLRYTYGIDLNNNNVLDLPGELITPAASFGNGTYAGSVTSNSATIPGSYFATPGTYKVISQIMDNDLGVSTSTVTINVTASTFQVSGVSSTPSGFVATFNRAVDPSAVNLYAGRLAAGGNSTGAADVTLVGATVGNVRGSMVWNSTFTGLEFVATGGILAPDTYTVTLVSGASSFKDGSGGLLDGDANLTAGGDYVSSFAVVSSTARVLSIADFARGASSTAGQVLTTPFGNSVSPGIPITINNGTGITSIDMDVVYDPNLIEISSASIGADALAAGWGGLTVNLVGPGRIRITGFGVTGLGSGVREFARIIGQVKSGATYGASEVISIENLATYDINGSVPSIADRAIHKAIFIGDTNASGIYTGQDAGWAAEVRVNMFTGFGEYPLTDPTIIADVTQNGSLDGLDSTWIAMRSAGIARPEIPNLPAGVIAAAGGVDPTIDVDDLVIGVPGGIANVPVRITDSAVGLSGFNFTVGYDTAKLSLPNGVNAGGVNLAGMFVTESGWTLISNVDNVGGTVSVVLYRTGNSVSTAGQFANLAFSVLSGATAGVTPLAVSGPAAEAPFSYTYVNGSVDIQAPDVTAPTVGAVKVVGTSWNAAFTTFVDPADADSTDGNDGVGYQIPTDTSANQLKPLPWTNMNRIVIAFSENVTGVNLTNIEVVGVNKLDYKASGGGAKLTAVSFNPATREATLDFDSELTADKLLIKIGAGLIQDLAGNSLSAFQFRLNVLPGDVNGNGRVLSNDSSLIFAQLNARPSDGPLYDPRRDINASGRILSNDSSLVFARLNNTLPGTDPT
ncbi:MAG: cohesin domain-containing protein, partial [Planctomycetota bacterium]|nr:cohesin domain-containing protein [Planctomycetota bacterium]